jgi:uncharacterized protein (TIGR03437 family)
MSSRILALMALAACSLLGQNQNYPYVFNTFAGTYPLGDGGPAIQALLLLPTAAVPDGAGNLYIADGSNYRIRKVAANGTISTLAATPFPSGMALGKDGNLYVTSPGVVFKVATSNGAITVLAGNDVAGFGGDGGLATQAQVGAGAGIALDSNGNIFFVDGQRVREITVADGKINTIAGTGNAGAATDNVSPLTTDFYFPGGLAIDSSNNIYIADSSNFRVRKISNGVITTILGTGSYGQVVPGPAKSSPSGVPQALTFDASGNLYVSDIGHQQILKVDTNGNVTQIAGQQATFGYADGPAATTYLDDPYGLSPDGSGGLYIAEFQSSRIRHLSGGAITTVAGMLHYAGDNGPASAALLYEPTAEVMDAQGNVYILDSSNFRVRKVAANGVITTFAGNGISNPPTPGPAASTSLPTLYSMAIDGTGNLYLGGGGVIYKITASGTISLFAGTGTLGFSGAEGDGGPALKATFSFVTALAADSSGNVYVGDQQLPRIRKITTDGNINNFAGTGTAVNSGDGGLATSAGIYSNGSLAVDAKGNVYIGSNNVVRMVTAGGIISTVAGNGTAGSPTDGATAKTAPFTYANGMTTDAAGNLYISSADYNVYKLDTAGVIHIVAGGGKTIAFTNGVIATTLGGFFGKGISVSGAGDLLVADPGNSVIRQLVLDSPTGIVAAGGNNQSAAVGTALSTPITVTVSGRGGVNVPGIVVNFTVTSGSATLSAASSTTDSTGTAGVGVTLGSAAGTVTITAAIAGSTLPATQFTETAMSANPNCTIGEPAITSVRSLTDFGGLSTFASGSWLEVKGTNLATDARLWAGSDFNGNNAPTGLDGSSVSINGNAGFVEYISSGQINVQAPDDPATGSVAITVTNCGGTSAAVTVQKTSIAPGVLATSAFNIGGKQYLVALYQDGVTYVGNVGLIAGVPFRPAKPGDQITVYGIGFGGVTPASAPGVIVMQQNAVPGLTVSFGQIPATTTYAGLSPGNVGLYQFNITVPNVPNGDYQINVSVGAVALQQAVYLTVSQ